MKFVMGSRTGVPIVNRGDVAIDTTFSTPSRSKNSSFPSGVQTGRWPAAILVLTRRWYGLDVNLVAVALNLLIRDPASIGRHAAAQLGGSFDRHQRLRRAVSQRKAPHVVVAHVLLRDVREGLTVGEPGLRRTRDGDEQLRVAASVS